jgi:hypothetical protein
MILTTHQPIFLPWPGFFHKAICADTMVLLDNVQFPRGRGWMTRNRLKRDRGELWLTVPVWKTGRGKQVIRDVAICDEENWRRKHLLSLRNHYAKAPYLDDYLPAIESIYSRCHRCLVDLNLDLIRLLWDALGIKSALILQSELAVFGKATDLLVSLCRALHAETYRTLPMACKYLESEKFAASGIELSLTRFSPPVYPQLGGDFRYNLSALDLLLNCGPKSADIISNATAKSCGTPFSETPFHHRL